MAHKYFLTGTFSRGGEGKAFIEGREAFHLIKVMRIRPGQKLTLTDGEGFDYLCVAEEIDREYKNEKCEKGRVVCRILSKEKDPARPSVSLTLFMALPKSDKLEFIAEKACELGADRLIPFISKYCVAQKSARDKNKTERLRKISRQACKQCGRSVPMSVDEIADFGRVEKALSGFDAAFLFYEKAGETMRGKDLTGLKNIAVIVGSEGGFHRQEAERLINAGAVPISLGKRILRRETAAVTATALVMFLAGQME